MEELLLNPPEEANEPQAANFATIGDVYEDGVSLIFDGETEESRKHYLVNTSAAFAAGQRVKITKDCGTYVVEYPVGSPQAHAPVLPPGGAASQVLTKAGAEDYDVAWENVPRELPSGGNTHQVLAKSATTDYAVMWRTIHEIPSGGSDGQVLTKDGSANYSVKWAAARAGSIINLTNTGTNYDIYLRTTNIYSNPPVFQIRMGPNGTWRTITTS